MNEILNKIKTAVKKPKVLAVIGIAGVLLIGLSSFFPKKSEKSVTSGSINTDEYREKIENDIVKIVSKITGDKSPTVVVTLESGPRYTYADTRENDTASGGNTGQSSEKSKRSYVTVRDADGSESALVIAESMPEIRGVAVICSGGESDEIASKITSAVTAALNITSKRVYISGGID